MLICLAVTMLLFLLMHYFTFSISIISMAFIEITLVTLGFLAWDLRRKHIETSNAIEIGVEYM